MLLLLFCKIDHNHSAKNVKNNYMLKITLLIDRNPLAVVFILINCALYSLISINIAVS